MKSLKMFTIYAILAVVLVSFILNGQDSGVEAGYRKKLLKTAVATYFLLQGGTRIVLPLPIPLPIPILKQSQPVYYQQPAYYQQPEYQPAYYEKPAYHERPAYHEKPTYQHQSHYYR